MHHHQHTHPIFNTNLLLRFFGHQFMVARNEKFVSAFLVLLKVYIFVVCFKISERNGGDKRESLKQQGAPLLLQNIVRVCMHRFVCVCVCVTSGKSEEVKALTSEGRSVLDLDPLPLSSHLSSLSCCQNGHLCIFLPKSSLTKHSRQKERGRVWETSWRGCDLAWRCSGVSEQRGWSQGRPARFLMALSLLLSPVCLVGSGNVFFCFLTPPPRLRLQPCRSAINKPGSDTLWVGFTSHSQGKKLFRNTCEAWAPDANYRNPYTARFIPVKPLRFRGGHFTQVPLLIREYEI